MFRLRLGRERVKERGSSLIETSLVIVVFLMFLFGIVDIGQFLFVQATLGERVRAGLRYGVITYDVNAIQNVVLYGTPTPVNGAPPSFRLTRNMVSVSRQKQNAPEDRVIITLANYPMEFVTPFFPRNVTGRPIVGVLPMEVGNLP